MTHHDTDFWQDADHRYVQRRLPHRRRIDPFYARVIALGAAGVLLIPVALSLRSGSDTNVLHTSPNGGAALAIPGADTRQSTSTAASTTTVTALPFVVESTTPVTLPTSTAATTSTPPAATVAPATATKQAPTTPAATAAPATAKPATATLQPRSCANAYEVVAGDYWTRIAQRFGVKLSALLEANGATAETNIFPGDRICLPAGAAATTKATTPATTAPKAPTPTAAPTTKPPATTAPATTAAPAPSRTYSRDEVVAIVRAAWPDELEDKAIAVATRESNLIPTAKNYCCYGLFQIYFSVHKSWLAGMGVTSATQLFDPHVNAAAAYALYQRAGGWGPWGG